MAIKIGHCVKRLLPILVAGVILLALYILFYPPHYVWHQKLTATVSTPHGMIESSSVTEVHFYDGRRLSFGLPEASGVTYSFSGEAVAVEIAPGRVLFVLLEKQSGYGGPNDWPSYIWNKPQFSFEDMMATIQEQLGKSPEPLPPQHWPLLATFDDLSKPETLHLVTGTDLSPWFGSGVRLEGLTLQITREPVTKGTINSLLPWLIPAGHVRGQVAPTPAPPVALSAFVSIDHWSKK